MCCVTLPCCLFVCFFLPSHLSLKHVRHNFGRGTCSLACNADHNPCTIIQVHVREMRRKKEASMVKQNKAKQHSTPKTVTFPKKNELPRVGFEPTPLHTLDRALYQLTYHPNLNTVCWVCCVALPCCLYTCM